jgi:hypothetical protein
MKLSTLCTLVFVAFCLLSLPQQAQAQYVYGYDEVGYHSGSRYVYGYGATYLDYYAGYY